MNCYQMHPSTKKKTTPSTTKSPSFFFVFTFSILFVMFQGIWKNQYKTVLIYFFQELTFTKIKFFVGHGIEYLPIVVLPISSSFYSWWWAYEESWLRASKTKRTTNGYDPCVQSYGYWNYPSGLNSGDRHEQLTTFVKWLSTEQ